MGASLAGGRSSEYFPTVRIQDIDRNGTKELILTGGAANPWYSEYYLYFPWREQSDIYMWNGENFVYHKTSFSLPMYRYQAVQDGDRATRNQEHDPALKSCQEAIFSDKLLGWSRAHKDREILLPQYGRHPNSSTPTPPSIPPDDPEEYPHLAAYARYRIMLLHVLQGNMNEAKTVYESLQEKFPEGSKGHVFALVAEAFWDTDTMSQTTSAACEAAVHIADKYKSHLHFLGSDYHNPQQDVIYAPRDVCPFK